MLILIKVSAKRDLSVKSVEVLVYLLDKIRMRNW